MGTSNSTNESAFGARLKSAFTVVCVAASVSLLAPVATVHAAGINDVYNLARKIETKVNSAQAWAIGNGKRGITIIDGLAGDRANYLDPILYGIDSIAPIASVLDEASGLVDEDTRDLLIQQAVFIQAELRALQQAQAEFVSGTGDCITTACMQLRDQLTQLLNDMYALSTDLTAANELPINVSTDPADFIALINRVPDFVLFPLYVLLQQDLDLNTILAELQAIRARVDQGKDFVLSTRDSRCDRLADPGYSAALSATSQMMSSRAHWLEMVGKQIGIAGAVKVVPEVGVAGFAGASVIVDMASVLAGVLDIHSTQLNRLAGQIDGAFDACYKQSVTDSLDAIRAHLGA